MADGMTASGKPKSTGKSACATKGNVLNCVPRAHPSTSLRAGALG